MNTLEGLSIKQKIVYDIFKKNPLSIFNIQGIVKKIDEKNEKISKRTVYRALEKLIAIKKIYCNDFYKGMRYFQLVENNYCFIVCKKCKQKKSIPLNEEKIKYDREKFEILGTGIVYYGICTNCKNKSS
ncbi:transcriptional repressor [Inediibacterium massiliense]|uniref:transcriptional repressor n=1 Tax=Inediibacterium massiliense TaxID=1658111 RepID=UPI0006B45600|nr:transcriptional repressor [Inediibacterium massiliense]